MQVIRIFDPALGENVVLQSIEMGVP